MSDVLLANPVLEDGWIDAAVGEAHLIRNNLLSICNLNDLMPQVTSDDLIYPFPNGYKPLVQFLEDQHHAPVIITNGAKQALGACFYALSQTGKTEIAMKSPHWALIPPLAQMHGLDSVFSEPNKNVQSYLLLAPNNPDGWMGDLDCADKFCKENNIPLIHDAAYYTHIYLPKHFELKAIGDAQIYSISKALGLSGLRLGYIVCKNTEMYRHILNYMETMTVGVSKLPQILLLNLFKFLDKDIKEQFEAKCRNDLLNNKLKIKEINSKILEIDSNVENIPGMFLWAKCKDFGAFEKAKLHIAGGKHFGNESYIRMNLGLQFEVIQEIVRRLNLL